MAPRREDALRPPVADRLEADGYTVRHEVAFNGRIADLVGVLGDAVVAVELKLDDGRTAIDQARAYQLGARRTYVAMPTDRARSVADELGDVLAADGVGLLAVDVHDGVDVLVAARRSERTLPFLEDALRRGRADR